MAGLTGLFRTIQEPEQDNDKLVDLFRNRAALKKEFAALREEKYQLQDRIKEHRGSIERVQQKLSHLEALLLDPEWVHNVVVFYQLRRLASHCESRLLRFAEKLKQQREERIRDNALAQWNSDQERKYAAVEARVNEHRVKVQLAEDRLQAARNDLQGMNGVSRMLHGKSREEAAAEAEAALAEAQSKERKLLQELEDIESREPPPHEGLDVAAKRAINFLILSFAQQMYLDYLEDGLAGMAKEAREKSVGAVNYGSKLECDEILECLVRRREAMKDHEESGEILQKRAQMLSEHAAFRLDDDAVPVPASVATVFDINANGVVSKLDANLLGENYFGVAKVLSR